jgi:hypothetical protein
MEDYDFNFTPDFADNSFNIENFRPDYSPSAFDSVNTDLLTRSLVKQSGVDESFLDKLSPSERTRYLASQEEDYTSPLASIPAQESNATQAMVDEFNKNYNPEGGFGSQWQTVGTNKIMINDDGTGTVLDPTTNQTAFLTEEQVQALIKSGTLNSRKSNYVKSTGGLGVRAGGARSQPVAAGTGLGLMGLLAMASAMGNKGGSSEPTAKIPDMSASRSQTDYGGTRPGSANVDYFTPTTYTPKAAGGGLMDLAAGGMSDLGGYSDGGRLLRGPGDGVSDSIPATIGGRQPARLATGEFVVPARIVSELGNGATEAGANKLYAMMDRVQQARRKTKNIATDTKAHKYLPA